MCDQPEFYRETKHKKSERGKVHKCDECKGKIVNGDRYVKIKGVWDGDFNVFYRHTFCHDLFDKLVKYVNEDGASLYDQPSIGGLLEETWNYTENDHIPSYWPDGVPVSYEGLRGYIEAARVTRELPLC